MKKCLLGISIAGFLMVQCGCISNRSLYHNKILVYSTETGSGRIIKNTSFIDYYQDTINNIGYPFDMFENEKRIEITSAVKDSIRSVYLLPNIYPWSDVPYFFRKRGEAINIGYTFRGVYFERKYFSLSKFDTVETSTFQGLCDTNLSYNWVVTRFQGDTSMRISGKRIRCWIFKQDYPHLFPPNLRSQLIYLDKMSLIPVQITTTYFETDRAGLTLINTYVDKSRIDSVFKRPWDSGTKKWNYSKCWKEAPDTIRSYK